MAATEPGIRSYLDGEVSLELPAARALASTAAGPGTRRNRGQLSLIACSRCLRVLRDDDWVEAETVIRELRSFEYEAPPRFEPVLCPLCTFSIELRRGRARLPRRRDTVRSSGRR